LMCVKVIEWAGPKCPSCGSQRLKYERTQVRGGVSYQRRVCSECLQKVDVRVPEAVGVRIPKSVAGVAKRGRSKGKGGGRRKGISHGDTETRRGKG
jgi:transcription elongation factor Elf1